MAIDTAKLEAFIRKHHVEDPDTSLEFVGAKPQVVSPRGYAVKLWWNAYFLSISTDGEMELLSLNAHTPASISYKKISLDNPMPDDFVERGLDEVLSLEECERFGIDPYNVHTGYRYFDEVMDEQVAGSPYLTAAIDQWHQEGRATHIRVNQ